MSRRLKTRWDIEYISRH